MRKFSSQAVARARRRAEPAVAGCGQVGMLKAKMAFRDANTLYSGQDYRGAAAKYEEAIAADPNLTRQRTSSSATATTTCIGRRAVARPPTTSC